METTQYTSKQYFKALSVTHLSMIIFCLFLGLIVLILIYGGFVDGQQYLNVIFKYFVPILAFGGLLGSIVMYRNKLGTLKAESDLNIKLANYRTVLILRYALLTGPIFFAFIATLLSGNLLYAAIGGLLILLMLFWKPKKSTLIGDLELNMQEVSIIENPDSIVGEYVSTT